ncbi:MAG: translation initiation factor IF-2 [Lachnospiraceae bacterium]|nr:translation initiation factor IF-2 [Lachnospiraceae bacterium]
MKEQEKEVSTRKTAAKKEVAPVQENSTQQDQPKKKKRIVIVGNPQNSKSGMNVPSGTGKKPSRQGSADRPREKKQKPASGVKAEDVAAKFKAALGEKTPEKPVKAPAPAPQPKPAAEEKKVEVFEPELRKRPFVKVEEAPVKTVKPAPEQAPQASEAEQPRRESRSETRQSAGTEKKSEARQGQPTGERRSDARGTQRDENRGAGGERRSEGRTGERRSDGTRTGERRSDGSRQSTDRRSDGSRQGTERRFDTRQGSAAGRDGRSSDRQAGTERRRNDGYRQGGTGTGSGERRSDDRRQGSFNSRGQGSMGGRQVFDKDKDADNSRQSRPGQGRRNTGRPAGAGSAGFADVGVKKDQKRDERRQGQGQDKDKKSRKNYIYTDEGRNTKGKTGKTVNKAGKFIKPEKKEEVVEEQIKVIQLSESITLKELAEKMKMQPAAIIKKLFLQGKIMNPNQELSYEEAEEIAMDYEILCEKEVKVDVIEELLREEEENEELMVNRPPVICVMGHVDHGKTSLLDAIRNTNVTDKEAGGITQHIGAYTVTTASGRQITFLDTPGHEAFTAMRMRGANSTDIAILVVAADDGVMPQTIEAINHAKAAGIEVVVAVNKIDKPGANVDRVMQQLTEYELVAEQYGGSTVFCPVSAKTGEGIENLLEMILLTADVMELKANPDRTARGLVIEAQLDKGRGPVATVLVQKGTLHVGDFISAGACYGKVRAMINDKHQNVKVAGPSTPVAILGLSDVPAAGEVFLAHPSDKEAKDYAQTYMAQYKEKMLEETKKRMSLDDLYGQIQAGQLKQLNVIIKADVQGSVEAIRQSLEKLSNDEVVVKCIHGGVGLINESDVTLAGASNAIIVGFNTRPDATAKSTAEREHVEIKLYRVIYQAIEDIERAMKGMLDPIYEEKVIGHAEVRQIFKASAVGNIAGSYVLNGVIQRNCKIRITRAGEQIYEGELASLKRFKDDVKEVKAGFECGLVFEGFDKMQELDIVEAYVMVEVPR